MTTPRYTVKAFGSDCLVNVTGWIVRDVRTGDRAALHVADLYEPGDHARAERAAWADGDRLNEIERKRQRRNAKPNARRRARQIEEWEFQAADRKFFGPVG